MKVAIALSTFALLSVGASAIEPSAGDAAVGKNAAPVAFDDDDDGFLDGVYIDADPEVKDCKQNCIDKKDCHDTDGNQCKNECKKKCKDDPDYDPDNDDDEDDDNNRDRDDDYDDDDCDTKVKDCKKDCIDYKDCKNNQCKNKCQDICEDYPCAYDYIYDNTAWENGNGSIVVKRKLLSAAFDDEGGDLLDGVVLGADKTQNKDCKDKCMDDKCPKAKGDEKDTCKSDCKRICKSDPDAYPSDSDDSDSDSSDTDSSDTDSSDSDSSDNTRSSGFDECKKDCIQGQCGSDDGNTCKTACKKRCKDDSDYSDWSSSFSYDGNVFASESEDTLAVKRNIRKRQI